MLTFLLKQVLSGKSTQNNTTMKNLIILTLLMFSQLAMAQLSVSTKINAREKDQLTEAPKEFLARIGDSKLIGYVAEGEKQEFKVEYYALIMFDGKEITRSKPQNGTMFPGTILFPGNIFFPGTILDKMKGGEYKLIFFIKSSDPSVQKRSKNWPGKTEFPFSI